mgnify:FL=1
MLKEVSGMEKKILLSSCETDYNSDLHSWIDIERQIKNLADAGFTHTQWMQNWEETCKNDGASLACDSVICNETPDDEAEANCVNLGKTLA